MFGTCRSLPINFCTLGVREVAGSNPVVPTIKKAFRVKTESLFLLWQGRTARELSRKVRVPGYIFTAGFGFEPPDFGGVVLAGAVVVLAGVVVVFAGAFAVVAGTVPGLNSLKPPAKVSTHIALYCGCEPHEIPAT